RLATLRDGTRVLGEVTRTELFRPTPEQLAAGPKDVAAEVEKNGGMAQRDLFRTGNFDVYGEDFRLVAQSGVQDQEGPADVWVLERREWGPWIGPIGEVRKDGKPVTEAATLAQSLPALLDAAEARRTEIRRVEKGDLGNVNRELEDLRLQEHALDRE